MISYGNGNTIYLIKLTILTLDDMNNNLSNSRRNILPKTSVRVWRYDQNSDYNV